MSRKPTFRFAALCLLILSFGCGDGDITFPGMVLPTVSPTGTVVSTETPGTESPTPIGTGTPTPFPTDVFATETPTPSPTPACLEEGETCVLSSDCCSEECVGVAGAGFICE